MKHAMTKYEKVKINTKVGSPLDSKYTIGIVIYDFLFVFINTYEQIPPYVPNYFLEA